MSKLSMLDERISGTPIIPAVYERLLVGKDLKSSYLCAWNADERSPLEEEFIKYCDDNNLINWD